MILQDVLFLASFTARSRVYAEALLKANLIPANSILFGDKKLFLPGQQHNSFQDVEARVKDFRTPISLLPVSQVNDSRIIAAIRKIKPRLVIYSGYGGQLVKKDLLNCGAPFLHIHPGWLPDYRGSTTIYYSIMNERSCGVSAIILKPGIDTGEIVKRLRFPLPKRGTDIDYEFDNKIRAELLVEVLKEWKKEGCFVKSQKQNPTEGTVYYIIHPVLKHLAELSL